LISENLNINPEILLYADSSKKGITERASQKMDRVEEQVADWLVIELVPGLWSLFCDVIHWALLLKAKSRVDLLG
jgi:hypothetical protein